MKNRTNLIMATLLALLAALSAAGATKQKPNIVVILADDMGYSDLGCYGSEIETPQLDALAANGLRFTQFYNNARCCPTRASLLTGLYPHQAGVGHMLRNGGVDGYRGSIGRNCVTIAEVLRPAGYRTYMVGKWHVTPPKNKNKDNWPLQRGFDRFYGTIEGGGSFFDPYTLTRDNAFISPFADPEYKPESFYYTEALSDHAVRFIAEHGQAHADKPFFMYLAYTAAHWPMHAPERDIAKFKGRYDEGYEPIRKARYEKMQKLGVIQPGWKLSKQAEDWTAVKDKAWDARCMEVYAAMIHNMDRGIGRVVEQLRKGGQLDNTLILFLHDNGGCAEGFGRSLQGTPREEKPSLAPLAADYLQPDMIPKQTRDGHPVRQGQGVMPGAADTWILYGRGWANVSNTPFREYKHWVHEGGISTPLIAHWPAGFKARNDLRHTPCHVIDLMATCADVGGAAYPSELNGQKIKPAQGLSLRPVFDNQPLTPRRIYWEHARNCAVRDGKWKLVGVAVLGPDGPQADKWELYDIEADRSELSNLAEKEPERVKAMAEQFMEYARRCDVVPLPPEPKKAGPKGRSH